MDKFYQVYDLFPEQITEKVRNELKILAGKTDWNDACTVLTEHPEMFSTSVNCIVYEG